MAVGLSPVAVYIFTRLAAGFSLLAIYIFMRLAVGLSLLVTYSFRWGCTFWNFFLLWNANNIFDFDYTDITQWNKRCYFTVWDIDFSFTFISEYLTCIFLIMWFIRYFYTSYQESELSCICVLRDRFDLFLLFF